MTISKFTTFILAVSGILASACQAESKKESDGFVPLFNGKDFTGWEGNFDLWKIKDGVIVGDSAGIKHNDFLATKRHYEDFELRLEFRLKDGVGNSGIQFRSARVKDSTAVVGYQADIGQNYWGCLYDEHRRRKVLAHAPDSLDKVLKKSGWNTYVIRARGASVQMELNGVRTVDYIEKDDNIARSGIIAVQVHSGPPLKIEFRNLKIKEFK